MKTIIGTLVVVVVAVLPVGKVESAELENGICKTESGTGEWTDAEVYDGCYASCQANYNEICLPAVNAASDGRIPQERIEPMCHCGVLVCANSCVRESGYPGAARALPQTCHDLGVD